MESRRPSWGISAGAFAFAIALLGSPACDDEGAGPPPRDPPSPAEVREALGEPPEREAPSPWPAVVEDLAESVARFDDVASCTARLRQRMPVEVLDLIADVGYDQLLEDACASVSAVRDGDVEACDALAVSSARSGCRRRLALVHERPEACPDDAVAGGREATCIAWASRDDALCQGAPEPERVRCHAVLAGDAAACARALPGERPRCRADVARLGPALGDERVAHDDDALPQSSFRLTATVMDMGGTSRPPVTIERDVLERGVRLAADGCAWVLALEKLGGDRAIPSSFIDRAPIAAVQVRVPYGAEPPLRIPIGVSTAQVMVSLPGTGSADSTAGAAGEVTLRAFAPVRGARIEVAVDGTLVLSPHRVHVEGTLVTFVRDVEDLPDHCSR